MNGGDHPPSPRRRASRRAVSPQRWCASFAPAANVLALLVCLPVFFCFRIRFAFPFILCIFSSLCFYLHSQLVLTVGRFPFEFFDSLLQAVQRIPVHLVALPFGPTSRSQRIRRGQVPFPGSGILPHLYISNKLDTKTMIPRIDTAQHIVETPTQGTLLLIGVREANWPHSMGARSSASKFINRHRTLYSYLLFIIQ